MKDEVENVRPAWFPARTALEEKRLTPRQVQRGALRYLLQLDTPAHATRTAGKGTGRPKGYYPPPRKRYPVVKRPKDHHNRL
jgi:hypothetical protein